MARKKEGTQFLHHFGPLLDALRDLGGSATPEEATDKVADLSGVSEKQLNETLPSGGPRVKNQVAWARFYLKREGLLDSSKRAIWSLTDKGSKTHLTYADAREMFKRQVQADAAKRRQKRKLEDTDEVESAEDLDISAAANYRNQLLDNHHGPTFFRIRAPLSAPSPRGRIPAGVSNRTIRRPWD